MKELSLQNTPTDLQSLKLIDFHLLRWSAQRRLFTLLGALTSMLKTSAQLRLENLALRQQLAVLRRSAPKRLKLTHADRIFWIWLRSVWSDWKSAMMIVKAEPLSPGIVKAFAYSVENPPQQARSAQRAASGSASDPDDEPQ
jgi:hypothetical protein